VFLTVPKLNPISLFDPTVVVELAGGVTEKTPLSAAEKEIWEPKVMLAETGATWGKGNGK